jgi:hypothetical protein
MKKALSIVLCLLMVVSLFGCGMSVGKEVNLRDKLESLMVTDDALGIKGKYKALADITDGSIDKDLVGTWKTADGETSYTFGEDGTAKATSEYGDSEVKFTCLTLGEYKVMCEESEMESSDVDGNTTTSTVVSYSTYDVDNDALYFTNVEDTTDENMDSSQYALMTMYRADESGSIDAAVAKNKIALDSFAGTWASEKGEITIADGTLTVGDDVYDISINDKGKLVVDKDGAFTEYSVNISVRKQYEGEDKTQSTETTALGLYFTGADENDKPNLESVLDDWGEFMPNYYSATFDLQK